MKTRYTCLLLGVLLLSSSLKAQASDSTDTALKDIAIAGSILSWGWAYLSGGDPFNKALNTDSDSHQFGVSHGYEQDNQFNNFYYAKNLNTSLINKQNWSLDGHWELGFDRWQSSLKNAQVDEGFILKLLPVVEYVYKLPGLQPYSEFAIGLSYLSNSMIENKQKSSQFHFVEYWGAGIKTQRIKIGYRFMHISNAGINLPNPSTDVHSLNFTYLLN